MKRTASLLLCALLLVTALAGCAATSANMQTDPPVFEEHNAINAEPESIQVTTVDEFLAAIGPNREIILAPGVYSLHTAANYGLLSGNDYYSWGDTYDGYALVLRDLENMTIRGSGKAETAITNSSRNANIINVQNCENLHFESFTAGHTLAEPGECGGGVVCLENSHAITLNELGLYGCGMLGVRASGCTQIHVSSCGIYECSSSGIDMDYVTDSSVSNCVLRDLGLPKFGGYTVISLGTCNKIDFTGNRIENNNMQTMAVLSNCEGILFSENDVVNNTFSDSILGNFTYGNRMIPSVTLDRNSFANNKYWTWYSIGSTAAMDAEENELTEDMLFDSGLRTAPEAGERTTVHVGTMDEFLAAIAPDTEIILDAELYDETTASDYGVCEKEYYRWDDCFDGVELIIQNVNNLVIRSADGSKDHCTISALPRYANVLTFENCTNTYLAGITAGHVKDRGSCTGGVVKLDRCQNFTIENCGLFGCGTIGVNVFYSLGINVLNCDIYECSYDGIDLWRVVGCNINGCTFRDLGGEDISVSDCKDVLVDGSPFSYE